MKLGILAVDMRYWAHRKIENATIYTARHLPRSLRKWVVVLAAAKACGNNKSPCDIGYREMHEAA